MTAELCDCYSTKAVGVRAVLDAAVAGLPDRETMVWGIDGEFHSIADVRRKPADRRCGKLAGARDAGGSADSEADRES